MSDPVPVSLDTFREAAARKHGDYPISLSDGTVVKLRRPMRMPKDDRRRLFDALKATDTARADHPDVAAAKRRLMAAQQQLQSAPAETKGAGMQRLQGRVDDAQAKLETALTEHPVDQAAQIEALMEAMRDTLLAVADSDHGGRALVAEVGEDFYLVQELITAWRGAAEPGEASPSPSSSTPTAPEQSTTTSEPSESTSSTSSTDESPQPAPSG